jgi:rRNA-processing protein FCF1
MTARTKPVKKLRIILDANALFVPVQFKIDLLEELKKLLNRNFEPILLSPTRRELERIAVEGSSEIRKQAGYALKLAEKCTFLEVQQEKGIPTDDLIVQVASKHKYAVFTNDRQLRNRLRDINVPVIYVRQKSRLEIDGRL